jgi:hypothetical protein
MILRAMLHGAYNYPRQTGQRIGAKRNVDPVPSGLGFRHETNDPNSKKILLRNHGGNEGPARVLALVKKIYFY